MTWQGFAAPVEFWLPRPSGCGTVPGSVGMGWGGRLVRGHGLSCSEDRDWLRDRLQPIVGTRDADQLAGSQP